MPDFLELYHRSGPQSGALSVPVISHVPIKSQPSSPRCLVFLWHVTLGFCAGLVLSRGLHTLPTDKPHASGTIRISRIAQL